MGLGPLDKLPLRKAQIRALALQDRVDAGIDPLDEAQSQKREQRKQAKATAKAADMTFRACAEAYLKIHESEWKSEVYRHQWGQSLEDYAYPVIGDMQVADIDEQDVLDVLEPIWKTKTKTARDLRARIGKVLGWAAAKPRCYRQGANPAAWTDNLEHSLSAERVIVGHAHLPYREIGAFMANLRKDPWIAARALELTILCALRTGEVRFARWNEIDLDKALWTIPARRMKMGKRTGLDHVVPLSEAACALLRALGGEEKQGSDELIFTGRTGRRLAANGMRKVCRRINPAIRVHGFRKTFRNWAGSRVKDFPAELAEFALAHVKKGVEGIYHTETSIEERRPMMQQWADYCSTVEGSNVTPFKRSA
jgi:integrase